MKKSYALVLFLLAAVFAYAQQAVDIPQQGDNSNYIYKSPEMKAHEAKFFGCPQCDFVSKVTGVCPNHQVTLLRFGTYYCPFNYHYTSAKKGSCPEHKVALKEMEMTYRKPYPAPADKSVK